LHRPRVEYCHDTPSGNRLTCRDRRRRANLQRQVVDRHVTGRPAERSIIVVPVSTGTPPVSSRPEATTVIGPPVSMTAWNVAGACGVATSTTARRTGCGLRPGPSPKSV
jgi:hypothetical protein